MSIQRPMPKQQDSTSDMVAESVGLEEAVSMGRRAYEAPSLAKKRSVARVTLFSGGGVSAGGLTASG